MKSVYQQVNNQVTSLAYNEIYKQFKNNYFHHDLQNVFGQIKDKTHVQIWSKVFQYVYPSKIM